jgi:hypothetical protein
MSLEACVSEEFMSLRAGGPYKDSCPHGRLVDQGTPSRKPDCPGGNVQGSGAWRDGGMTGKGGSSSPGAGPETPKGPPSTPPSGLLDYLSFHWD